MNVTADSLEYGHAYRNFFDGISGLALLRARVPNVLIQMLLRA